MALVSVGLIREALAARLETLDGLFAYAYPTAAVQAGPLGAALIRDAELDEFIQYHAEGGTERCRLLFEIMVLAPAANQAEAARVLDDYRSVGTARSLLTLLESGGNLGGVCNYVTVLGASNLREYNEGQPDARLWETTFTVEVRAG